jgi:hypothetical protein
MSSNYFLYLCVLQPIPFFIVNLIMGSTSLQFSLSFNNFLNHLFLCPKKKKRLTNFIFWPTFSIDLTIYSSSSWRRTSWIFFSVNLAFSLLHAFTHILIFVPGTSIVYCSLIVTSKGTFLHCNRQKGVSLPWAYFSHFEALPKQMA